MEEKIKEIYDAPVSVTHDGSITKATVLYEGTQWIGTATLDPDDEDMQSNIVGGTIAHMHAIIDILKYKKRVARNSLQICYDKELNSTEALKVYKAYRDALKKLYRGCYKYIRNQEKAYQSLRALRKGKSN